MNSRTAFEASVDKKRAQKAAEASGLVADSGEVRRALMARVHDGEISLAQAQTELKRIQRGAKGAGKLTRAQAFNAG